MFTPKFNIKYLIQLSLTYKCSTYRLPSSSQREEETSNCRCFCTICIHSYRRKSLHIESLWWNNWMGMSSTEGVYSTLVTYTHEPIRTSIATCFTTSIIYRLILITTTHAHNHLWRVRVVSMVAKYSRVEILVSGEECGMRIRHHSN